MTDGRLATMAILVDPDGGADDVEHDQPRNLARLRPGTEANRRELVANAGHELKTPLSIILGLSGRLIAATAGDAAQQRDVERIRSNAYALLKQVDDLLMASRIDDGRAVVEPRDCDVAALVRDTAMGFQSLVEERGQRLVLRTPGRPPARVGEGELAAGGGTRGGARGSWATSSPPPSATRRAAAWSAARSPRRTASFASRSPTPA